jgi:hypothetical protein
MAFKAPTTVRSVSVPLPVAIYERVQRSAEHRNMETSELCVALVSAMSLAGSIDAAIVRFHSWIVDDRAETTTAHQQDRRKERSGDGQQRLTAKV